jgi:hypothetical protein
MVRTVLTCPHCGSSDLYYENAMITGIVYHCKRCDYIGPLVLEQDIDEDDIIKNEEPKEKEGKGKKGLFKRT